MAIADRKSASDNNHQNGSNKGLGLLQATVCGRRQQQQQQREHDAVSVLLLLLGAASPPRPKQRATRRIVQSCSRFQLCVIHRQLAPADPWSPEARSWSQALLSRSTKDFPTYEPGKQFDEQKDQAVIEQILGPVFLDPDRPSPVGVDDNSALEKLRRQLADADAVVEARKRPPEDAGFGEGLVIDEWKERRERYLARQLAEVLDSI